MPRKPKKTKKKSTSLKGTKLFQNLLKITEQFMRGRSFTPLTEMQLMEKLDIPPQHKDVFREVLRTLVKQGVARKTRKGVYCWQETHDDVVSGMIKMHPRGFGFVQSDGQSQDIFIPRNFTQNAVDGDHVEVVINQEAFSEKGPEGKVIAITQRGRTHVAGTIAEIEWRGDMIAYVPMLGRSQRVVVEPSDERRLHVGDRIVMEVIDWGDKETETVCRLSHYIGHISDPSCDIMAAIEEHELPADFPIRVKEEAANFGKQVSNKEIQNREDLRELTCITIDPDTARDFDDALSLVKDKEGHYHLGVHIADVSYYVQPDSLLDKEAMQRSNSTYFPGQCIPMLPEALSNNLCSLKPNVNRLTASVLMQFDPTGTLVDYRMTRGAIKSAKRFTYKEAKQVLDGSKKSPHSSLLKLMVELCGLLKKKRYERGSIEFAIPELVVQVDTQGKPFGTEYVAYDITHQLVEEFMLKANETVASHLSENGKNLPYRVHEEPAEENMREYSILANAFGFKLPENPSAKDLQLMFDEALDTPAGQYLAVSYIRRMKLALYSPENIGHYGLGLSHYCHFTSPIRRYVDLVVHRILFGDSDEKDALKLIAEHCSERERISAKAENSVVLLKKLRLLQQMHEQDKHLQHEAVVTQVKNMGIVFEVIDLMLEGFLHVSELDNDYFVYDADSLSLQGTHTNKAYHSGDKITVMLTDINLIYLETKWTFVSDRKKK